MQIKSQTQSRQDEDVFSVASKPACYFVKQQVQLAQNPKNENRVEFKFDNEDKKIRDFFDKSNQLLPIVTLGFEQEQERILRSMITKVLKFGKMDQIRSGVALQLAAPKTYSWLFQKRFQYIKDANWIRQFQRFPFIVDQSSVEWVHIAHQKRDDEERLKNQRQYSDNQQIIYQNLKVPYRESPPLMDNQLRRMRWLLANFGDVKQDIDMSTSIQ